MYPSCTKKNTRFFKAFMKISVTNVSDHYGSWYHLVLQSPARLHAVLGLSHIKIKMQIFAPCVPRNTWNKTSSVWRNAWRLLWRGLAVTKACFGAHPNLWTIQHQTAAWHRHQWNNTMTHSRLSNNSKCCSITALETVANAQYNKIRATQLGTYLSHQAVGNLHSVDCTSKIWICKLATFRFAIANSWMQSRYRTYLHPYAICILQSYIMPKITAQDVSASLCYLHPIVIHNATCNDNM